MTPSPDAWGRAWRDLGAETVDPSLHGTLLACWREPHRHYHTEQHLRECLEQLDAARDDAERPAEVALALWFHDAIYDPQAVDNERRSAEWARQSVLRAGLPDAVAQRIASLVLATQHGAISPGPDPDAELLLDIDLSILGAPPVRFDEYERQVRAEYAHLDEASWRAGRARVLQAFLNRPRLYATERFHAAREAQARANLAQSLGRLSPGSAAPPGAPAA